MNDKLLFISALVLTAVGELEKYNLAFSSLAYITGGFMSFFATVYYIKKTFLTPHKPTHKEHIQYNSHNTNSKKQS